VPSGIERNRELRRRRKRTKTYAKMKAKLAKASPAEKAEIARKLRLMTPGAENLIVAWQLEDA
jgi:hypothetical protein